MRTCFVPNCDAQNKHLPSRPRFFPPRNPEMFKAWEKVLPKKRALTHRSAVCSLHFNKSDYSTDFRTVIEGKTVVIERTRPKLSPTAVPCKFLNNGDYPKRGRKRNEKKSEKTAEITVLRKIKVLKKPKPNDITQSLQTKQVENSIEKEDAKQAQQLNGKIESKSQDDNKSNNGLEKSHVESEKPVDIIEMNPKDTSEHTKKQQINSLDKKNKQNEIFNNIYEDIFEVVLPSTLWGIHRDSENKFIAITYFDNKEYLTSKSIIFKDDMLFSIYIYNKCLIENSHYESIDQISDILKNVDKMQICSNIKRSLSMCKSILDENDAGFCNFCKDLIEKEFSD